MSPDTISSSPAHRTLRPNPYVSRPRGSGRATSLLAAVSVFAALVLLVGDYGGLTMQWTPYVALLVALGLPALVKEMANWPRSAVLGYTALSVATTLSLIFAISRSFFFPTLLIESGFFIVTGASAYLWRNRPRWLAAILLAAAAVWTYQAVANWLVVLDPSQPRLFRPLGWHNPSAPFYGAFTILGLSIALLSSSRWRTVLAALGAGAGVAAIFLTGSRGGEIVFALSIVLLLVATRPKLRAVVQTGVLSALSAGLTYVFFQLIAPAARVGGAMPEGPMAVGTVGHVGSASGDFSLRVMYWKTAVRVFEHYPLFGTGPGSWSDVTWRFVAPLEDYSTAAHNIYLQTFAEQGVFAGLALVLLALVGIASAWKVRAAVADSPKKAVTIGAGVASVMMLVHAGIDFDNRWPVVMWMLAVMIGIVAGGFTTRKRPAYSAAVTIIPVVLTVVLLLTGVGYGAQFSTQLGNPLGNNMSYNASTAIARVINDIGHREHGQRAPLIGQAVETIDAALRYSPGDLRLQLLRHVALYYSLEYSPTNLLNDTTHQPGDPWALSYLIVAQALSDHNFWHYEVTLDNSGIRVMTANPGWDTDAAIRSQLYAYEMQAEQVLHPCSASVQVPLIKADKALLATATATVYSDIHTTMHEIAASCPSLATYTK